MKYFFLFALLSGYTFSVCGQSSPTIEFSKLQSCEIQVEIDSSTQTPTAHFVDSMKKTEVVWFIVGERSHITLVKAQRVGYFRTEKKDGKTVTFIMPKDRSTKHGGTISGVYPNWELIPGLKFYNATCFYDLINKL